MTVTPIPEPINNLYEDELRKLLTLAVVPRWAIISTYRPQNVAEHSFLVAAITLQLVKEFDKRGLYVSKSKALELAIIHDIDEAWSGDIPTPYKRLKNLQESTFKPETNEAFIVKLADLLEAAIYLDRYAVRAKHISDSIYSEVVELIRKKMGDEWVWLSDFCHRVYMTGEGLQ